jgi:hypothetical protein
MKMSQENSLYIYPKQKCLSFKTKLENRRAEQVLSEGLVPMGVGRM